MPKHSSRSRSAQIWNSLCRAITRVFFRRVEVARLERFPSSGPVVLCANHLNALADPVLLEAVLPRTPRPLARSGLFDNPLLRPILRLNQAIPVYRRMDATPDSSDQHASGNVGMFDSCFEVLDNDGCVLIFPEGVSHSDPSLKPLKTGAARIVLGQAERSGAPPVIVPCGLTWSARSRFRSDVMIQIGEPISYSPPNGSWDPEEREAVLELTQAVEQALREVTLNVENWEDLYLMTLLERFVLKNRDPTLDERFIQLKRFVRAHRHLRIVAPEEVEHLKRLLRRFDQLCRNLGIRDEHLLLHYRWSAIARYVVTSLVVLLLTFVPGLWSLLNSLLPFSLTRVLAPKWSQRSDQITTNKIVLGLGFFTLFWGGQTTLVAFLASWKWAAAYAASLVVCAPAALALRAKRSEISESLKGFLLFTRNRGMRNYLIARRKEIANLVDELSEKAASVLS